METNLCSPLVVFLLIAVVVGLLILIVCFTCKEYPDKTNEMGIFIKK